jgi:hypothetical protein
VVIKAITLAIWANFVWPRHVDLTWHWAFRLLTSAPISTSRFVDLPDFDLGSLMVFGTAVVMNSLGLGYLVAFIVGFVSKAKKLKR